MVIYMNWGHHLKLLFLIHSRYLCSFCVEIQSYCVIKYLDIPKADLKSHRSRSNILQICNMTHNGNSSLILSFVEQEYKANVDFIMNL